MSSNNIDETEGYGAALTRAGQPDDVHICGTYEQAVETLAQCAILLPLEVAEVTATIVDLIDDRTITEHTGTPTEVAAMLNGDTLTDIDRNQTAQWVQALTAAGFTTPTVDWDLSGTCATFTAHGTRYCLAADLAGETTALILTRDYRRTYDPADDPDSQLRQIPIYATTIRQAAELTADTLQR